MYLVKKMQKKKPQKTKKCLNLKKTDLEILIVKNKLEVETQATGELC